MSKEDLEVQIGTKEEKAWRDIRDKSREEIETFKRLIEINEAIVALAVEKVKKEQKV